MKKGKRVQQPDLPSNAIPPATTVPSPAARPAKFWPIVLFFAVFALLVFRDVIPPGKFLFHTDDNIGALASRQSSMPHGFLGAWSDEQLIGHPAGFNFNWSYLLLWLLPVGFYNDVIHGLDLLIAAIAFAWFLWRRGLSVVPAILGGLTAVWLGSSFFLIYAGHINKFGTLPFAALFLVLAEEAARRRSILWAVLAGCAMGNMFVEQTDLALFFAIPFGLYVPFALYRECGWKPVTLAKLTLVVAIVAGLFAFRPIWIGMQAFKLERDETTAGDASENWDYCTQWSWPPEETIEFIAPGYTGWRSGEADGPYWGRMGRSAEWEKTGQGFQNFKLETLYLGSIPVAFGLLGLLLVFHRDADRRHKLDMIFWASVCTLTFLLSLGKFFPLYRLFYELPGMSSIRNPVKFMQVFQMAFAVLAAFGLEAVIRATSDTERAWVKKSAYSIVAFAGILGLWFMGLVSSRSESITRFRQEGWGDAATKIVETMTSGLGHGFLLMAVAAGAILYLCRAGVPAKSKRIVVWALVAIVAVDQLWISRRYVQTMPREGYIAENGVTRTLKSRIGHQRAYMPAQGGFYNFWLTYLLPYHQIPAFNVTQLRMPEEYKRFLQAMGNSPMRLWQAAAIGQLVGPANVLQPLLSDPSTKDRFALVYPFNVYAAPGGGVAVADATPAQPGQHAIVAHTAPAPRYQVIAGWESVSDDEALKRLASPDVPLFQKVMVADGAEGLQPMDGEGPIGSVDVVDYKPGRVSLKVTTDKPGMLRVSEKFEPAWRARVNGTDQKVHRVDYIFQGVAVAPGTSMVDLRYEPDRRALIPQAVGILLMIGAGAVALLRRRQPDAVTA